ncbi:hypothetical protein [Parasitella parasitica]|uniref:Uncharacterized protein n=1 Tax=Parasitella parasitica TaxID=35722 RepID=A0A0B7N6Y8_9FUNG|nr:hypothetical protein [Parasitella parasitica]
MVDDTSRDKPRRVSSLEAAGVKVVTSPTAAAKKKVPPVLPSPISTARTGRSHTAGMKTPNSATSPAISSRLTKTPILKNKLTPSNSRDTASLKKKIYNNSSTTKRSSSRLSTNSSSSSIKLTPTNSRTSNNGTVSIKRSLIIEELTDKYHAAQAALADKDNALKQREADLKDVKARLEQMQFKFEQQISANKHRAEEEALKAQLNEHQRQVSELKQSFEREKLDILANHQEAEEKNRQNIENLREKLDIEKELLNNTTVEKNRVIEKLNHELDEMRDNIKEMHQTHQTRLTAMSKQLESKYEQRINSLLEQISANELEKKHIEQKLNAEDTQKKLKIELENEKKQLIEVHDLEIQNMKLELLQYQTKCQELSRQSIDIKTLQDNQIVIAETALETEKLKYATLVTKYNELAKTNSDLEYKLDEQLSRNNELTSKVEEYEFKERQHLDEIKSHQSNTLELRSTLRYQQLQEEQMQKEIDIAKKELSEEFQQQLSFQKASYTKDTNQLQDKIDALQFELNVCIDKLNQSNEDQAKKKSTVTETSTYKKHYDLQGGDSEYKLLVHQHQKELNVLQEQFQSILDIKDNQINDLVYKVKKSHFQQEKELVNENEMFA